jgi:hypothetical protein
MLVQRERGKRDIYRMGIQREGRVLVECLYIEKVRVLLKSLFKREEGGVILPVQRERGRCLQNA